LCGQESCGEECCEENEKRTTDHELRYLAGGRTKRPVMAATHGAGVQVSGVQVF
jgi:hypothetical protein